MIIIVLSIIESHGKLESLESQKAGKKHEINGRADHKKERLLYIGIYNINIKKAVQLWLIQ